jgi:quercetin dioxygenase-like cupin family protein
MATKPQAVFERDPVKLDAKHYKVELENDRVRVVRVRYAGGEKSVMHQHPPGIIISLTEGNFRFSYPDGKVENIQLKAGESLWFGEVWEHLPENLSDKSFDALYVELKS